MNKNKTFHFKIIISILCVGIFLFAIYNTNFKNTKTEVYNISSLGISLNLPEDDSDSKVYKKMKLQASKIISTLKVL